MNSNLKTSVVLDLAADAIQMAGWTQGTEGWPGYGEDSGLCLEGGIMAASGIEEIHRGRLYTKCPAYTAIHEYLEMCETDYAFEWNDKKGRTQNEVIETLRAAAAVERVKEATASATYETTDQPLPVEWADGENVSPHIVGGSAAPTNEIPETSAA